MTFFIFLSSRLAFPDKLKTAKKGIAKSFNERLTLEWFGWAFAYISRSMGLGYTNEFGVTCLTHFTVSFFTILSNCCLVQIFRRWKKLFIISYLTLWHFSYSYYQGSHFPINGKLKKKEMQSLSMKDCTVCNCCPEESHRPVKKISRCHFDKTT